MKTIRLLRFSIAAALMLTAGFSAAQSEILPDTLNQKFIRKKKIQSVTVKEITTDAKTKEKTTELLICSVTYNRSAQIIKEQYGEEQTSVHEYNKAGDRIRTKRADKNGTIFEIVETIYDSAHNPIVITDSSVVAGAMLYRQENSWTSSGKLKEQTVYQGITLHSRYRYFFDAAGKAGGHSYYQNYTETFYDTSNQVTKQIRFSPGGLFLSLRENKYDATGRILQERDSLPGGRTDTRFYEYDGDGLLLIRDSKGDVLYDRLAPVKFDEKDQPYSDPPEYPNVPDIETTDNIPLPPPVYDKSGIIRQQYIRVTDTYIVTTEYSYTFFK